jgi:hypothetical protein
MGSSSAAIAPDLSGLEIAGSSSGLEIDGSLSGLEIDGLVRPRWRSGGVAADSGFAAAIRSSRKRLIARWLRLKPPGFGLPTGWRAG